MIDDENEIDGDEQTKTSSGSEKKKSAELHCYIGQGNNPRIVRDALSQYGYKEMSKGMQFSDKYRYKWT